MRNKQSTAALARLLECAIESVGDIPRDRLYVSVREVEACGRPLHLVTASVLVRFLPMGAPFCCGEPVCYSRIFSEETWDELGDQIRREMGLRQRVNVRLDIAVEYFEGIEFTAVHEAQVLA